MSIFDSIRNGISGNSDDIVNAGASNYDEGYEDDQNYDDGSQAGMSSAFLQLKVVKPESYGDVSPIAKHLLSGRTVVLNLEKTNKETARRLLDFLAGVVFSIDGQLEQVAVNTYIITPNGVDVTGDQIANAGEAAAGDLGAE